MRQQFQSNITKRTALATYAKHKRVRCGSIKIKMTMKMIVASLIAMSVSFPTLAGEAISTDRMTENINSRGEAEYDMRGSEDLFIPRLKTKVKEKPARLAPYVGKEVSLAEAGELEKALSPDIYEVDSLVVKGPINDDDFRTMWDATFNGRLTVINLENADIEGGKIPAKAFWHYAEQCDEDGIMWCVGLERIIFPEGLTEIGDNAFCYAKSLKTINIPSTLRAIGANCFEDCDALVCDKLVFPEGFETLSTRAFLNCRALGCEVVFPSTLEKIEFGTFWNTTVEKCVFSEGLKSIGRLAFRSTKLNEVYLPESCTDLEQEAFSNCLNLKKIHFSSAMRRIPDYIASDCMSLETVDFPEKLDSIGFRSFMSCSSLGSVRLPECATIIGAQAFSECHALTSVYMGTDMKRIGQEAFSKCSGLDMIYCGAIDVPECEASVNETGTETTMFKYVNSDIPVYVRRGMADAYRNAYGWDHFTNFIEIDDFPEVGGVSAVSDGGARAYAEGGTLRIVSDAGAVEYCVYSIDGRVAARGCSSNVALPLDSGTYIVKYSGKSLKIKM